MDNNRETLGSRRLRKDSNLDEIIPQLVQQEKNIGEFEVMVNMIHPGFWRRILKIAPNLTPMELRVCGLTRLHMHAKEAARILNITPSSVETHRSNARLKLRIDRTQNFKSVLHAV